jgi:hypothetical protein
VGMAVLGLGGLRFGSTFEAGVLLVVLSWKCNLGQRMKLEGLNIFISIQLSSSISGQWKATGMVIVVQKKIVTEGQHLQISQDISDSYGTCYFGHGSHMNLRSLLAAFRRSPTVWAVEPFWTPLINAVSLYQLRPWLGCLSWQSCVDVWCCVGRRVGDGEGRVRTILGATFRNYIWIRDSCASFRKEAEEGLTLNIRRAKCTARGGSAF